MTIWIVLRAAGIGAYVMLFLSVAWGLVGTTSLFNKAVSKPTSILVHQFMSTVGLLLLAGHLALLSVHDYMPFSLSELFVPMESEFRPVAVTLGIIAMYAIVVVMAASWVRRPLGTTWWRRTHLLAVPAFALALMHGVLAGTDTGRWWMWWTYLATGGLVIFLVIVRALTAGVRPERAPASQRPSDPEGRARTAGPPSAPRALEATADPLPPPPHTLVGTPSSSLDRR